MPVQLINRMSQNNLSAIQLFAGSCRVSAGRASHSSRRPRIGLALSGGGARAGAHLGVIRGLVAAGVTIDCMVGTSAGALMGLMFAAGYSPQSIIDDSRMIAPSPLMRRIPGGKLMHMCRLLRTRKLERTLRSYLPGGTRLENLQTPMCITTTDLDRGQMVVHDSGDPVAAVLGSMSVPGLVKPRLTSHGTLVDGGVLNNLPAAVLKQRGADIVIGVDLAGGFSPRGCLSSRRVGAFSALSRSLQLVQRERSAAQETHCDVMLRPDLRHFGFADLHRLAEMADVGEQCLHAALPLIHRTIANATRMIA